MECEDQLCGGYPSLAECPYTEVMGLCVEENMKERRDGTGFFASIFGGLLGTAIEGVMK